MKKVHPFNSLFSKAYLRDGQAVYTDDAMLIAVIAHTGGKNRNGFQGKVVRQLMQDINEI